ncbi:MAG: hypothetical protein ACI4WM_08250 [Erysipelotrichaceae bacterium]
MKPLYIVIILVVIAMIVEGVYQLNRRYKRGLIQNKLMQLLMNGSFKEFEEYADSFEVKTNVKPFNLEYIKMNAAIMQGDSNKLEKSFNKLLNMKMNDEQREEVYLNCFNHYIDKNDSKKARQFKELLIKNSRNSSLKTYVQRVYDVKIEHSFKYLDEMLNELSNKDINKATHYLLIAEMYKNKNDNEKAAEYYNLYNEYMESKK